jgi:serine/threonine protein kinase
MQSLYCYAIIAYMAPEVFTHTSPVGRGADIWSLGCVLIEMVTGNVSCSVTCEMVFIHFIVSRSAVCSAIYYSIELYCF